MVNEELGESLSEEEEPIFPDLPREIPGVVLESDLEDRGDVMAVPPPSSLVDQLYAAFCNENLSKLTWVHGKSTGVD